ncbi:MAG: hypothetical protein OXI01_10400 [Albidovulum sp.]|nr:hypothetical protein [Albidovulum sp.]
MDIADPSTADIPREALFPLPSRPIARADGAEGDEKASFRH